jgi:LacI family xylobiose transport system transcriptional regulator
VSSTGPDTPTSRRPRREITVAHIARLAGVSAPTVSKVLNGHSGVALDTRQRIEEIIREHGYQRAESSTGYVPIVELLFQALDSLWALEIIRGVEQAIRGRGLAVALTEMQGRLTPGRAWTEQLLARRPAGVIAVSADLSNRQYAQLSSRAIPLVALDPTGEPAHAIPSVGATNWNGGLIAARHLLGLGHRRIAMINGPDTYLCCRARFDGYRAALEMAGVRFDPGLVRTGPLYVEGGQAQARALLRRADRPTAVFAANDLQALGVYEAARELGLRVPQELSVVGFDDLPFVRWHSPALTTVRQPLAEMGAAAATMLLRMVGGDAPEHDRVELPTSLVVRGSTAPPAT